MPKKAFFALNPERREEILVKAMEVYVSRPYEEITLQVLLDAFCIPPVTFYRYFSDKDELYLHLQKLLYDKETAFFQEADPDFYNSLYFDTLVKKPMTSLTDLETQFMHTLFHLPNNMLLRSYLEVLKEPTYKKYKEALRDERLNGNLRPNVDEDLIAYMYATTMFNLILFCRENGIEDASVRNKLNHYFYQDFFLHGVLKETAQEPGESVRQITRRFGEERREDDAISRDKAGT